MLIGATLNKYIKITIQEDKSLLKLRSIIILLAFNILILISGCYSNIDELKKDKLNPYSISLGSFNTYENALKFKMKLNDTVRAHLRLEYVAKKKYKLLLGKYSNSYDAGEKGFELFLKKHIKNYEINRNGQRVLDEFVNIPFIGYYLGKPVLYNYNMMLKQTELQWSRYNKKVLSVSLTKKAKAAFIITANANTKNKSNSSFNEVSVHYLNRNEDETKELLNLGNVDRIYSYWDMPDTFRINVTNPDSSNARIIYQRINSWDNSGKIGKSSKRSFDILLQGYPLKPKYNPEIFSPNGKYKTRLVKSNETNYVYLKNYTDKSEVLVLTLMGEIKDIIWSENSRYLIFISEENQNNIKRNEMPNQLFAIYDIIANKIVRIIDGSGFNNLLLRGKFLFYDIILNDLKHIEVIDIENNTIYDSINIPGGCALNTLPE